MSKTPQFDKVLDEILKDLKPHQRTCKICGGEFEIFKEDIEMYAKLRVPPPTLCPLCRMQRRMALALRLPPFYKKSCSAPGHADKVISLFPESSPHKVYDNTYWRSDAWDALDYGKALDQARSFFEQFRDLFFSVPHQALFVDPQSVNSEYSIGGIAGKNCYYVSAPLYSEDILYAFAPTHSRDSVDVNEIEDSEYMYESVSSNGSFNCNFCIFARECRDSWFLYDCRNCDHCFMCSNLRNKSYYFYNQPLSKEEYEKKIQSLDLGRRSNLGRFKKDFEKFRANAIHKYAETKNVINSIGDRIRDCKNCFFVFWAHDNCENIRFIEYAIATKDSMDIVGIDRASLCYMSGGIGSSSYIFFSSNIRNCSFIEYSAYCRDSDYCFGCVGVRNKKFCIFNQQYDEENYWKKVDEIKTAMLRWQEYGEFFPMQLGLVPYQNTYNAVHFPLTKDKALRLDIPWYEDRESGLSEGIMILRLDEVPDDIREVKDDILEKAIQCEVTGKPFRIIKQELEFYRKKGLPVPTRHPDQRMRERFDKVNRFRLWQYPCSKCGKAMWTSYDPLKKLRVYCESCYLREVV